MTFRVVQPWGKDRAIQATVVSVHSSTAEAFAEIDRLADRMVRTGDRSDAVELIVVDGANKVIARPGIQRSASRTRFGLTARVAPSIRWFREDVSVP